MESKLNQQQKSMTALAKPKYKTSLPEKQNTWSNLLNKKSAKSKKNAPISDIKKISKSVQCDSSITKLCHNSNSLSVLNPIRTLQFLLKEIIELPNIQNIGITKIINEMQVVVEKIITEYSENVLHFNSNMPVINDDSMIPTRDNDYCKDLKDRSSVKENKYFNLLLEKVSELESKYGQLIKNYTSSEEKLLCVTSERDKLLEKFKESCNSMEMFNNREREYLDTITELKSKLIISEKLISKQDTVITNLNKRLNNLSNKNQLKVEFTSENLSCEPHNVYRAVLKENNELKKNNSIESNLDKLKITNNFLDGKVSKLRSDMKQKSPTVMSVFKSIDDKSSMTSLKTETNLENNFSKYYEDIEKCVSLQYTEHQLQASAIKQAKIELEQLFETIKTQANLSKKLFHSTIIDNEINLSDISDEEDTQSNATNFISVVTDSNC